MRAVIISMLSITSLFALNHRDVRLTMREMFAYHVEQKEFSPHIVKRSFKVYLEQFDPDKIYLTQPEIEPYLNPSEKRINKVIEEYNRDDFREYYAMSRLFSKAIKRSHSIRAKVQAELLSDGQSSYGIVSLPSSYAKNESELKKRITFHMQQAIHRDQVRRDIPSLDPDTKTKMVAFWEKKRQAAEAHYTRTEHQVVLHILKALAKSLDAHTGYYSPEEAYEIRASLQKQLTGVGIVFREEFDGIFVADVLSGGPAGNSGAIQPGDRLISVNEKQVDAYAFSNVLEELKGEEGSKVRLEFHRPKTSAQFQIKLRRAKVVMEDERLSYTYEPVGGGIIGKIDLPAFYDNGATLSAERDLRHALRDLKSKGEVKGLILDMRQNSGGFLNQAVKVAGMFLTGGVVVISRYSDGEMSYSRDVDGRQYYSGPLVVLTSKASASAAEIVAGALQDHGAALIIGDERTYGKGSMQYQTLTDPRASAFFKVTVGRYYTASGRSPQIEGVRADVHVPTRFSPYMIGERYLEYPISQSALSSQLATPPRRSPADVVPHLKPRQSTYRQMLPSLTNNTDFRLDHNRNFKFYLKLLDGYHPTPPKKQTRKTFRESNFGVMDLQVQEGVNILKDMIFLKN